MILATENKQKHRYDKSNEHANHFNKCSTNKLCLGEKLDKLMPPPKL